MVSLKKEIIVKGYSNVETSCDIGAKLLYWPFIGEKASDVAMRFIRNFYILEIVNFTVSYFTPTDVH